MVQIDNPQQSSQDNGDAQNNRHSQQNVENNDEVDASTKLLDNGVGVGKAEEKVQIVEKEKNNVGKKKNERSEQDRITTEEINKLLNDMPLTDDLACGFGIFKNKFFQRFANQTAYVILYGLVGCVFGMTYAYFNGTITTIEKRFKIPSKNTGIISVGNDISQMMVSAGLSYYAGKGHRPRWIGFGLMTIVAFCLLTALPHLLYGPGEDALSLTEEYGGLMHANLSSEVLEEQRTKNLCKERGGVQCEGDGGQLAPQVVLFVAQFISGIGGSLYYTLGVSYMDDNTKKSKTPVMLSLSYFLRMLGPAMGYALASFCLRVYIVPHLTPLITNKDPRWLGAWWMGWLVISAVLTFFGFFLSMFPKQLPRAAARRMVEEERRKRKAILLNKEKAELEPLTAQLTISESDQMKSEEPKASFSDMLKTFRRLTSNKTWMSNNFSSVFYFFGYTPYWIFTPKYIEIIYRQSAATSSLVTGTVALAFSAAGVLLSGFVISKYKPRARYMAAWNVFTGFCSVMGIITYAFIGCPGNESSMVINLPDAAALNSAPTCNSACHCDYVRYSPVCGENSLTYISPCHAGCKSQVQINGTKFYYDCGCIPSSSNTSVHENPLFAQLNNQLNNLNASDEAAWNATTAGFITTLPTSISSSYADFDLIGGKALSGACPVNCFNNFVIFLSVMCVLKFVGATGRATNFLVGVRCVPEKDKTAAMGLGMMLMSMLAFIPSPIFFGWVLDRLCLVWGKTCTNKGNCWLYDPESLRYTLNFTASVFVTLGTLFDAGVWYYVKDLKIFDEEVKEIEMEIVKHEEELTSEKKVEA